MKDRKPIKLDNVTLSNRKTGYKYWTTSKSCEWRPLCDENFIELWQKSDSLDHFTESYRHNHPKGRAFSNPASASQRYLRRGVQLKKLYRDTINAEHYNEYLREFAKQFTTKENNNEV